MSRKRFPSFSEDEAPRAVEVPLADVGPTLPAAPLPPPPPMVQLDVYCLTSGRKPDQTKAFRAWATRQGFRAFSMDQWNERWQQFQTRPV